MSSVRTTAAVVLTLVVTLSCGDGPTDNPPPVPSSIAIASGNTQSDTIGALLGLPLVVRVLTQSGAGIAGVSVQFQASSNGSVSPDPAITNASGLATSNWTLRTAPGPDTVIATVASLTGQQAVFTATVSIGRLAHLTIIPDTVRFFKLQDSTALAIEGTDRAFNVVTLGSIAWSTTGPTIASVSSAGLIRSLSRGTTKAIAQDVASGVRDTATVVVSQTPVGIVVTPDADTLNWLGQTAQLTAAASDSGGSPITGVPFSWQSLDSAIAPVSNAGLVQAQTTGAARIVVSYLGVADTAAITVRQVPASVSIAVDPDTLVAFSDTARGGGFVLDSGSALISSATIVWSSSNSAVAELVAPKVVVARGNGSVFVTGSFAALADTETLVVRQRLADVQLQPPSATLAIDQTTQFRAVPFDRNGFEIDTAVVPVSGTWRPLHVDWLDVSAAGLATARAAGVAGVVFRSDTTADTALVTVQDPALGPVTSWDWLNPLPQGNTLNAISGNADNNIWAVGTPGTILHFDGGNWTVKPRVDIGLLDVWVSPTGQVFAAGGDMSRGYVLRGYNNPWTIDTIPPFSAARAIWGVSDTSVFALTDAARVMKFNGTSWSELVTLPASQVMDIEGLSSQLLYVSGGAPDPPNLAGVIYQYNGSSWNEVYRGFNTVTDLWVAPDSSVYALARTNTACFSALLHSNGVGWDTVTTFSDGIERIHGRTQQDIYATGVCNGVEAFAHADSTGWTVDRKPILDFAVELWASPGGTWFAVGAAGSIQTNSGAGWQAVTTGLRGQQYVIRGLDLWLSSANNAYLTGRDARILHWNGTGLSEVSTPFAGVPGPLTGTQRPLEAIWGTSASDVYVGGGFQNACVNPPLVCDGLLAHFNGSSWQAVYEQGIVIHSIWGTAPDDIFAVGHQAALHFDGTSWTRTGQGTFDTDQVQAVWGYRSNDVWACGQNRDIYHFNGQDWSTWGSSPIACGALLGFSSTDIYMVGFSNGPSGTVNTIGHYNGSTWSVVYTGVFPFSDYSEIGLWGSGPNDVHVTFGNEYLRFNGSTWTAQQLPPMGPLIIRGDSRGTILGSGELAGLVKGRQ
jgi:hypothetical protein